MDGVEPGHLAAAEHAATAVDGVHAAIARGRWTGRTLILDIEAHLDPGLALADAGHLTRHMDEAGRSRVRAAGRAVTLCPGCPCCVPVIVEVTVAYGAGGSDGVPMSRLGVSGEVGLLVGLAAVLLLAAVAAVWVAAHRRELRAVLGWLGRRPWLQRLRSRHGRAEEFLVARLRPQGAYGLSFTTGLASLGLAVIVFARVAEDVVGHEELALLDRPVTAFVACARTPWLTTVMHGITLLGSIPVIAALIVAAGTFLRVRTGSWRPLLLLTVVSAGAGGLDWLAKVVVARPRPPAVFAITAAPGYSFPSGHTVQAAAYGCLAYLIARQVRSWRLKVAVWSAALVIAALVGLSRVYLGVHWLTDVLGAWALATAWLAFVLTVTTTVGRIRPSAALLPPARPPPGAGQPVTPAR